MSKKITKNESSVCSTCYHRKRTAYSDRPCSHRKDVEAGRQEGCPISGPGDNLFVWG